MRRGPRGACGALLALLLVLVGSADAAGAHDCPHHDGPPAAAHGEGPSGHVHEPASDAASHGPCTCFGRCHAGEAPTLLSFDPVQDLAVPPMPQLSVPAPTPPLRSAIVPFSLPWGNAPPRI